MQLFLNSFSHLVLEVALADKLIVKNIHGKKEKNERVKAHKVVWTQWNSHFLGFQISNGGKDFPCDGIKEESK